MGRIKSHSGAKKRFKPTVKGAFRYRRKNRNHFLTNKSKSLRRHIRANKITNRTETRKIKKLLS